VDPPPVPGEDEITKGEAAMRKDALTAAFTGTALAGLLFVGLALAVVGTGTLGAATAEDAAPTLNKTLAYKGKDTYGLYCRSCHGAEARGDGSVAEYLKLPPTDLTRLAASNGGTFPFEDVYQVIDGRKGVRAHGSEMPVWGDAFQKVARVKEEGDDVEAAAQKRIEELVHYLMLIQTD
jgi:mono/diheme cytochrome c family protein